MNAPDADPDVADHDHDEARTLRDTTAPWDRWDPRDNGHGVPDKGWE